jgi:hypothetical protein
MTGNIATNSKKASLVANDVYTFKEDGQIKTDSFEDCLTKENIFTKEFSIKDELIGYTRLGIKADFKSWIKNAV